MKHWQPVHCQPHSQISSHQSLSLFWDKHYHSSIPCYSVCLLHCDGSICQLFKRSFTIRKMCNILLKFIRLEQRITLNFYFLHKKDCACIPGLKPKNHATKKNYQEYLATLFISLLPCKVIDIYLE